MCRDTCEVYVETLVKCVCLGTLVKCVCVCVWGGALVKCM